MTIPYAELEQLWITAGGPPSQAPVAAAIAMAESSGNPYALNATDNGGLQSSYGLWQISNGTHGPPSSSWANPVVNAQLAVGKYVGAGDSFTPWGTYDSGAYQQYLTYSIPSAGTTSSPPPATTPSGAHAAGGYSQPRAYYDQLITSITKHSDIASIQHAMDAWRRFGTKLQQLMGPLGTPGAGCATGNALPPQASLAEALQAHLSGWEGDAAQQLLNKVEMIRDFGNRVGLTMYDNSAGGSTLHSALSVVQAGLAEINTRYLEYKNAYQQWTADLARILASYGHDGLGASGCVQYLHRTWAHTIIGTYVAEIRKPHCTIYFTIYDQTERHTIQVAGTVVSTGRLAVFRANASPGDIERQLIETFTQRYKNHVGPLADMITSNSGCYRAAARMLPVGVDGSNLPPGHANQGPGGSRGGHGAGAGLQASPIAAGRPADGVFVPTRLADVSGGAPGLGPSAGSVVLGGLGAGGLAAARLSPTGPAGQAMPMTPPAMVGTFGQTRQRQSWLAEDDGFWETDDVVITPVISDES